MFIILCVLPFCLAIARIQQYDEGGGHLVAQPFHGNEKQSSKKIGYYRHLRMLNLDTKPNEYPTGDNIDVEKHEDSTFLKPLKNLCVGNRTNLTASEKLEAFRAGVCQPIVLVPALMSTRLMIRINCTQLKEHHPQIFDNCGWTRCGSRLFGMVGNAPEEEYTLWVGVNLMFTPLIKHGLDRKCFGDLISPYYDNVTKKFMPVRGTNVTWFGNTTISRDYSDCGINAITNLAGFSRFVRGKCDVKGMLRIINAMRAMGYQSGVTMQAVPYDWRPSLEESDSPGRIINAIRHLHKVTGKKVVLVAHSMGGLHALHALSYFMNRQEKDEKIRQMLTIGTAFGGSASAIRMIVSGQSNLFDLKLLNIFTLGIAGRGINFYAQTKIASTAGFVMDTLVRPTTNSHYWEEVDKRILHEKNSSKDNPYKWYPAIWECGMCQMGLINYNTQTPIIILGKDFKFFATETDYEELFTMLANAGHDGSMLELFRRRMKYAKNLDAMPHPEVNISVLFSNMFQTESTFSISNISELIRKHTAKREFVEKLVIVNGLGDSTVQATSALYFVSEWQKNKDYTTRLILYSGKNRTDPELVELYPNFSVIPTECNTTGAAVENCMHACLVGDSYIVGAVIDLITNKKAGYRYDDSQRPPALSDEDIKKMQKECPGINPIL